MDAPVVPRWRDLPPEVVAEVEARRAVLVDRARRPMLDLDAPDAWARLAIAEREPAGSECYASILCTCALIDQPDLVKATLALAGLLADDGELLMVEPVNRAGLWGLLTSSVGSVLPAVEGLHLARDVVGAVRATGLTVADLDRFDVPTRVWPLRRFVQLRAVRIPRGGIGS